MTRPAKGNSEILADTQAFKEAYARATAFFEKLDGVLGVGFGLKETAGRDLDEIAIIVYVREKKPEDELSPEERVPPVFEGYRTDVRVVRAADDLACENTAEYERLKGGIQVMPPSNFVTGERPAGTLGGIVKKRNDSGRENVYLLSCKHVLYSAWAGAGTYAYHPFSPGGSGEASKALGPIQPLAFKQNVNVTRPDPANPGSTTIRPFYLDCAIARIDLDSTCCGSTCTENATKYDEQIADLQIGGVDTIADVRDVIDDPTIVHTAANPRKVIKVGRTSGRTVGRVVRVNSAFTAPRDSSVAGSLPIAARNTIEIDFDVTAATPVNCKGHAWFAEPGDSGALVLDEQGRVIGLVTSGPQLIVNGVPNTAPGPTYANHIVVVLDSLKICIPALGASHGSSRATDGSGALPTATSPAQTGIPAGQIVFTGAPADAAPLGLPGMPAPMALNDEDVRRMRKLLALFREAPLGPELHAAFAHVRREAGYLVRNCRPVTVAWHRHKGPAYLAHTLNHLAGHSDRVPHEVQGVTRRALLIRMREMLGAHGSMPLRDALARYGDALLEILSRDDCNSATDCIALLHARAGRVPALQGER